MISSGVNFFKLVLNNRGMLISLAATDFKKHYLSSYLGLFWAIIHPIVSTFVMWFVFQLAFKAEPVNGVSFVLWLVSGLFPWFYFSEATNSSTNSLVEYEFLIKKMVFPVGTLPIVKIISSLLIHLIFLAILFVLLIVYGQHPSWHWWQLFYYIFSLSCLLLGLAWFLSALSVFIRDVSQVVAMFIQIGFWATPLLWSPMLLSDKLRWFVGLNPLYYIIDGYRGSLLFHECFWDKPVQTLYFWSITIVMFLLGAVTFQRLKPHFADVL